MYYQIEKLCMAIIQIVFTVILVAFAVRGIYWLITNK